MKKILPVLADLLIIYGSIILVFYLFEYNHLLENFEENFQAFEIVYPFIGVFCLILLYAFGLYDIIHKDIPELIYLVFLVSISLMFGIMGFCFLVKDVALAFPRSVIIFSTLLFFILLSVWHFFLWILYHKRHSPKKITIVEGKDSRLSEIVTNGYARFYQIENRCTENDSALSAKIKSVDEVFIHADISPEAREKILMLCFKYDKAVLYIPKYFDLKVISSSLYKTGDIPTFRISDMSLSPEDHFVKRIIDVFFGTVALILSIPLFLIFSILIKLDGGPVFYIQERLTLNGKPFKMFKFRTMKPNAEADSGPVLAINNDQRITKVGNFMRILRVDEIPQLLNILKGEMSIVGPRPERSFFVQQFEQEIPEYHYRFRVKAGLTGLAQIEGKYNTSVEDKLRYDLIYINSYSVIKDFLIMLRTVKVLFFKSSTEGIKV
ncbi:sugar transferase [Bacteroidia bacterium]|nr:sugar transferase [Bacteroidia bacterium]GHV70963.1 sugar transferase [Bacteroidia bacterium]